MSITIDFVGKVVLITGVSCGIGLGTAIEFARAGAHVAGCSRKATDSLEAKNFRQKVQKEDVEVLYVQADVTNPDDLNRFVYETIQVFGRIDVVVSNAGVNIFEGAERCSEKWWNYNMELNLASHWRLAKICKPYLEESEQGVILLMTSNHALHTIPGCFPYNVAKMGITALVQSLAIEWGPAIRTVGIAPGFIDTEGNDTWFDSFPDAAAERRRTINLHPVKRIGTVEEVGDLCVYLASPMARFISGTTVLMDGGRSALMQDS